MHAFRDTVGLFEQRFDVDECLTCLRGYITQVHRAVTNNAGGARDEQSRSGGVAPQAGAQANPAAGAGRNIMQLLGLGDGLSADDVRLGDPDDDEPLVGDGFGLR